MLRFEQKWRESLKYFCWLIVSINFMFSIVLPIEISSDEDWVDFWTILSTVADPGSSDKEKHYKQKKFQPFCSKICYLRIAWSVVPSCNDQLLRKNDKKFRFIHIRTISDVSIKHLLFRNLKVSRFLVFSKLGELKSPSHTRYGLVWIEHQLDLKVSEIIMNQQHAIIKLLHIRLKGSKDLCPFFNCWNTLEATISQRKLVKIVWNHRSNGCTVSDIRGNTIHLQYD